MAISTNQDTHDSNGIKKGVKLNPEGKGGFGDNPQNRSDGRWSKDNSFSYWMNFFKSKTVKEFKEYEKVKPEDERTVAESLAYARVAKSRNDLQEFKEVADRTEGKSMQRQQIDQTLSGDVSFINKVPRPND